MSFPLMLQQVGHILVFLTDIVTLYVSKRPIKDVLLLIGQQKTNNGNSVFRASWPSQSL